MDALWRMSCDALLPGAAPRRRPAAVGGLCKEWPECSLYSSVQHASVQPYKTALPP